MRLNGVAHSGTVLSWLRSRADIADTIPLKGDPIPTIQGAESQALRVQPNTVWVVRWANGSSASMPEKWSSGGNAILRQPGKVMFTLFDSEQQKVMRQ
jgi:hypothetical protein